MQVLTPCPGSDCGAIKYSTPCHGFTGDNSQSIVCYALVLQMHTEVNVQHKTSLACGGIDKKPLGLGDLHISGPVGCEQQLLLQQVDHHLQSCLRDPQRRATA
ncbi:hypothetical protein ABBQ38_012905 [Trebouxia sp. C0009 RCD-2024]